MEEPNSVSRISYVILPNEPSVVTAKEEEISVVSVAAVFKSPPTPESVSSAVVPTQVSEVETLVVPLEERIEEVSVKSSPNPVSEFSFNSKPLEVSEVSALGGVEIPNEISEINIQSTPIQPRDFRYSLQEVWNLSRVSVRVFYEAPAAVESVSSLLPVAPNEPNTVSIIVKVEQPDPVLVEYSPNSVLEGSISAGGTPVEVESVEAISSDITELGLVSVSYSPSPASVISVSYTTNDTSVPVVEYSSNSVASVEANNSPATPSEVSSGYIPYDVDSVNSEFTPSTALDIHPGYITYEYSQAVLHEIDNDLVTYSSNPLKDRTRGRPAISYTTLYGDVRIFIDSEGDAYVLGKMSWGTEYTSWTKILDGVKSVYRATKSTSYDSYLFLKENSELWAWGNGSNGRLLTSNQSTYTEPIKVQENIKDVHPDGFNTTVALKNDGTLIGAGDNFMGVLDTGTRGWQYTVVEVTSNVKQVYFPYRDYIYILKNDNYIYVNGRVKGPGSNDYSKLHQFRGNVSEIFPDTQRSGQNVTYTYLNNSTHYRYTDYIYYSFNNSYVYQETGSGFSNVRYVEKGLTNQTVAIHTDQDIYYSVGTNSTFNIPYTGGTFGDVKYIVLGINHIVVRTDNTYVEVDNLLVKTPDSDNITTLETATLHTFPKYPNEVHSLRDPLTLSDVSVSTSPEIISELSINSSPGAPYLEKYGVLPYQVSDVTCGTLPQEVESVGIVLNPVKAVEEVSVKGPMPNAVSSVSFVGPMPNPVANASAIIPLIDVLNHDTGYSISIDVGQDSTGGTIPLDMIYVNADTFTMGSPTTETGRFSNETQHEVTFTKSFYMSKYAITQAQFYEVVQDPWNQHTYYGSGDASPSTSSGPDKPVTDISWFYATSGFCGAMNVKYGPLLPQGWSFTLPTEMQWEFACRAGTSTVYSFGDIIDSTKANYQSNIGDTVPVNHPDYSPNPWGFHQMHGNVQEWTLSRYGVNPTEPQTDPLQYGDGSTHRITRGGGFTDLEGGKVRSAAKNTQYVTTNKNFVGFRIILQEG
jgi:formylglycine-generating enzyme required for sulfatase activity